jgi:hypothetical protein
VILSSNIPLNASTFIARCTQDMMTGRFAQTPDGYRDYLIVETRRRNRGLLRYLHIPDSANITPQYSADADHIIPQSVWPILMFGFPNPGAPGTAVNALSNLFWRDISWNRGLDQPLIEHVTNEAGGIQLASAAGIVWRERWIEIFLRTKHDEGLLFPGELLDPFSFDDMLGTERESNWLNRG